MCEYPVLGSPALAKLLQTRRQDSLLAPVLAQLLQQRGEGAEVIAGKASLAGSEVALRGKVIKMNASIMGRNWLHLSDGTVGPDGERAVIASTEDIAAVGSTVVVRGTVATDRDFGSGYNYSVLIEDAKVTAE